MEQSSGAGTAAEWRPHATQPVRDLVSVDVVASVIIDRWKGLLVDQHFHVVMGGGRRLFFATVEQVRVGSRCGATTSAFRSLHTWRHRGRPQRRHSIWSLTTSVLLRRRLVALVTSLCPSPRHPRHGSSREVSWRSGHGDDAQREGGRDRLRLSKEDATTHWGAMDLSLLNADKLQTSLRRWSCADVLENTSDGIEAFAAHEGHAPHLAERYWEWNSPHDANALQEGLGVAPDSCRHEGGSVWRWCCTALPKCQRCGSASPC